MELTRENFQQEIAAFKKEFKEDVFSIAEKSLRLEKRGNVGLLIFDQFQENLSDVLEKVELMNSQMGGMQ